MSDIAKILRQPTHSADELRQVVTEARQFVDTLEQCSKEVWSAIPPFITELHVATPASKLIAALQPPITDSGIDWPLKVATAQMTLSLEFKRLVRRWGWDYLLGKDGLIQLKDKLNSFLSESLPALMRLLLSIPETRQDETVRKMVTAIQILAEQDSEDQPWVMDLKAQCLLLFHNPISPVPLEDDFILGLMAIRRPILGHCLPSASSGELVELREAVLTIEEAVVEAPSGGVGKATRQSGNRKYLRGELDEAARALFLNDPKLTHKKIAEKLGCSVGTLKNTKRCPLYHAARSVQKGERRRFLKGREWKDQSGESTR